MQADPTVCAILLTRDRPAMAKRAVESFRRQTYANKRLLILDTGAQPCDQPSEGNLITHIWHYHSSTGQPCKATIGSLRNTAADFCLEDDVLCHWDDDDWSHPNRIAEQVALLQASGADAVGYSDLLFWDTREHSRSLRVPNNKAWLYTRPSKTCVPGTSLMYKRSTWERKPFPHLPEHGNPQSIGEDVAWQAGLKVAAVSSVNVLEARNPKGHGALDPNLDTSPRMFASVHGSNTMAFGYSHIGSLEEYRRVECWDNYCAERMKL